ncbi:MAG: prepilin-type N-terminal cleavage/methylation domain-containing protein [Phycisphaerales bacterium]|nr:prepilin-type N-terminal cleavage/methylation domain-containing protein [Phycisphaerales bacterium]
MMADRSSAQHGFTLIEILVVVVILGIASAVILPSISSRDDLKVAAAARIVMSDLIYAQNQAITNQKLCFIQFDKVAGKYTLYDAMSPATILQHPINHTDYVEKFGSSASAGLTGITLTDATFDGKLTLAFDEMGSPRVYDSGTGTTSVLSSGSITLTCGSNSLTLSIEPYTGEISIQ